MKQGEKKISAVGQRRYLRASEGEPRRQTAGSLAVLALYLLILFPALAQAQALRFKDDTNPAAGYQEATAQNGYPVNVVSGTINLSGADGAIQDGASPSVRATVFDRANSNPIATQLVDSNGDPISVGGGTQYNQGTAASDTDSLTMAGCVRVDAAAVATGVANGDRARCIVDATGQMWVHVGTIDGGVITSITNPVAATQSGTWSTRTQDGAGNAVTSRTVGAARPFDVAITDGSGNQVTNFGGGTQYTEDVASAADPIGTMLICRRRDSPSTETTTDGDNTAANCTAKGEIYVKQIDVAAVSQSGSWTVSISGTVAATQSGTWNINNISGTVSLPTGAATESSLVKLPLTQGSTTSGQSGVLTQGAVTTSAPTYSTGQTSPLSLQTDGSVRSAITNTPTVTGAGGTFPVTGTFWQATQPVSGTFWQATQPVSGTFWQATQPVSGTVTTTPPANASSNVAQINGVTPLMGTGVTGTGSLRVTIATDQAQLTNALKVDPSGVTSPVSGPVTDTQLRATPVPVSGTVTTTPPSNASTNMAQVGGATIQAASNGLNTTGTGLETVALSAQCDDTSPTAITENSFGHVRMNCATHALNVNGLGTAGTAAGGVVTIQGVASMTKLLVTPDSVALPANQSVNVAQVNGVTPLMGNGTTGTGSPRVTIASDNTTLSNTFGNVGIVPITSGGLSISRTVSAATTNATNVKASAGQVYAVIASNVNAAARYIHLFNTAGTPTCNASIVASFIVPGNTAGAGTNVPLPDGAAFGTGIGFCITTAVDGTGSVAANDLILNVFYK